MSYGTHYLDGHRRRSVPIAIQPRNKRNKSAKTCNDLRAISFLAPFVRFPQGHRNGHLGGFGPGTAKLSVVPSEDGKAWKRSSPGNDDRPQGGLRFPISVMLRVYCLQQ